MDFLDESTKNRILSLWKKMGQEDKGHFINQVALALSIWGSGPRGKRMVVEVIDLMSKNGTTTLSDFGLYVDKVKGKDIAEGLEEKIERASLIIEGYRIKHSLPSEPHRTLF